ncbi:MAG: DHA2 family efflux MFS transporter permease subunit [Vulcanimicrobiota bacterium]
MDSCIVQDKVRQRWIVFCTCFASFMCVLDAFIVNISLPAIAHDFNVNTNAVARIIIVYLLVLTSTIPLFGKLGDRIGLTKVFISGFIVFTLGSLLCGTSISINMLILSRCIQALGGAMLSAVPAAIIPRFLPAEIRGASFGAFSITAALGLTLGAPLGGLITTYFSWHYIFLINVPVGILAVILIKRFFPQDCSSHRTQFRFDIPGVALSFFGLTTLLYCLNNGPLLGWFSRPIIVSFVLSVLFLTAFVLREKRCDDPVVDLRIFRNRNFSLANLSNFFQFMVLTGNGFLLSFYLILAKGVRADRAGLIMLIYSLIFMVVGPLAGKASDRISPRILCSVGAFLSLSACFFFSQTLSGEGLWQAMVFLAWLAVSFGLFMSPINNLIMSSAPVEDHGTASAMLKTVTNLGSAFGVCIFETVFTLGMPRDVIQSGRSLMESHVSLQLIFSGLQTSYLCGCVLSFLALLCMLSAKQPEKKAEAGGSPLSSPAQKM